MYREASRDCPFCAGAMDARPLSDSVDDAGVDVCVDCGAAFFDFHDGEPRVLAERVLDSAGVAVRAAATAEMRACPACTAPLAEAPYLGNGPVVMRCASCGGLAATRAQLIALVAFVDVDPGLPAQSTLLQRVALGVEEDAELSASWIALRFPEEQYTVTTPAELWVNVIGALADALDRQDLPTMEIDVILHG